MKASLLLSTLFCSVALALPRPLELVPNSVGSLNTIRQTLAIDTVFSKRQSCAETCGSVCYDQGTLDDAVNEGFNLYQNGEQDGNYPHTYNNYEGFDFPVNGPYQEYPVLSSYQVYTGGSPGPDRVIFNTQGEYAGTITHTGASGNNFVACDD